jgi:hypothetical protein
MYAQALDTKALEWQASRGKDVTQTLIPAGGQPSITSSAQP